MDLLSTVLGWIWSYGVMFILVLTIVVFIHELGHFLVARWCGVTVKAFSIGFGPEIYGFNDKYGTRWRFAWIPLGGYVKFMDDENAASVPSAEALKNMSPEERAGSFHAKPIWQRAAVVAAGPIANFLLAIAIYAALNMIIGVRIKAPVIDAVVADSPAAKAGLQPGDAIRSIDGTATETFEDVDRTVAQNPATTMKFVVEREGKTLEVPVLTESRTLTDDLGGTLNYGYTGAETRNLPVVGSVSDGGPASKAGFEAGDRIVAINGQPVNWFEELVAIVSGSGGKELQFAIKRGDQDLNFKVAPQQISEKNQLGQDVRRWIVGLVRNPPPPQPVGLFEALRLGIKDTYVVIETTLTGLSRIGSHHDQIGGPIMMAQVTAKVADQGLEWLAKLVAFFSTNIGLINLLPIPILDGGHLLFYGIEAVRRKPLSERVQSVGFQLGLVVILGLMFLATFNDLAKIWTRLAGAS